MKNSFSIFELIITILISSIIVVYSSLYIKNIYLTNKITQNRQIAKLNLLNTKIFLEKNKKDIDKLVYINKKLLFKNNLLLENIDDFIIIKNSNIIKIKIYYKKMIKQEWIL